MAKTSCMPLHEDRLKTTLRAAHLKVTPMRLSILEHLIEKGQPLSHAEIQTALPDIDRVTLYRTLASFVKKSIVHQVQGLDGAWRFCAHPDTGPGCPGNHPHFLCTSCGKMVCLLDQNMPRIDAPDNFDILGKQLVAYGRCPECQVVEKTEP